MIRLLSIGKQLVNSSTCLLKQVLELAKLELYFYLSYPNNGHIAYKSAILQSSINLKPEQSIIVHRFRLYSFFDTI